MNLWQVQEEQFDPTPKKVHSQETVYSIGNGYFCTRGTFEEDYPGASPATLIYGVFDKVPIAEEELANVPDWVPLQLFVNGERFRLDRGHILQYQRTLDMQSGILRRRVRWESPAGTRLLVTFERCASLADEHLGLLRATVTLEQAEQDAELVLLASFNTAVGNYNLMHWESIDQGHTEDLLWLKSVTRQTDVELAQAMSFRTDAQDFHREYVDSDIAPGIRLSGKLAVHATLTVEKRVTMYTSRDGAEPLPAALNSLRNNLSSGYDAQIERHREAWQQFWHDTDILIEGDALAQLGTRYSLYQLRANASLHDPRYSIAAKGLTGFGYHGHIFHDTEVFMLPFFTYTMPAVARNLLIYRYTNLPAAREKARANGYRGAQYAWESALDGSEKTPPAILHPETNELIPILNARLEIHINASIAYAAWQYWQVTGDDTFMSEYGAEIIASTALFWESRVEKNRERNLYEITDVIGPDEWHEHVNNSVFTNVMARWNLVVAQDVLRWLRAFAPARAAQLVQQLDLTDERLAAWRDIVRWIVIPHDDRQTALLEQFDGFFRLKPLDQEKYQDRHTSYQALLGLQGVQEYRIIKQADVLMLLTMLREEFDRETKRVNWEYYHPITDHDYGSSLTPAFHAVLACQLGEIEAAYNLFMKGALIDLRNLRGNTPEGIHAACCGAVWQAIVFGFAGLRATNEGYSTEPHLPGGWTRLAFSFLHRGQREFVDIRR